MISTTDLIANVRGNTTYEPDRDEGGMATLASLDADLLDLLIDRALHPECEDGQAPNPHSRSSISARR